ncbi:hypothetical protein ZIOFF_010920 [Zingiber officinale]|uniref:Pentatricopeptide repeat-containing protein n=1 Tax=Zingiber officinale TaxID=94328 RepID=A0A8J5HPR7_ZINOF|nr:hypothetical protein ZIOFF_010920 [Zingiber officinale]
MERQQTIQTAPSVTAPLFEYQIREYRRNQRKLYNTRRAAQRLGGRLTGCTSPAYNIEQQLDTQAQLQTSMTERALSYLLKCFTTQEEIMSITKRKLSTTTKKQNAIYSYWDPQFRIQTLHRQEGVLALIVFRDNKWNIQISLLTRGYDQWRNGEANLLITTGLVGRLSNTPNVGFAYEIQGVVDYLASHSVSALPRRRYPTTPLLGLDWVIRPTQVCIPMQPMELSATSRGTNGFGSTDDDASSSNPEPHTTRYKPNWDFLISKEKQIISAFAEEETLIWHLQEDLGIDYARATSLGATVFHPIVSTLENPIEAHEEPIEEDDEFSYIHALEPSSLQLAIYPLLATYSTADNLAFPRHPLSRAALLLIFISVALGYMKLEAWFLSFCSVSNRKKGSIISNVSETFIALCIEKGQLTCLEIKKLAKEAYVLNAKAYLAIETVVWINAARIVPNLFFPLKGIRNSLRKILKDLGELDYDPNVITYTTVMKCYFRHGKFEQRFQMFDGMIEKGYTTDVFAYCAAIIWINAARIVPNLFFPLKEIQNSLRKILKDLGELDYDPNVITYTTVMKCCFRHGKCEQGFQIFDGMIEKAVQQMFLHIVQQ